MKQEWETSNQSKNNLAGIYFKDYTLAELKAYCKSKGIKGSTNKKRNEIMELIAAAKKM